jgi:hypothetical protein
MTESPTVRRCFFQRSPWLLLPTAPHRSFDLSASLVEELH